MEPFGITDAQSLIRRKLHEGGTLGTEADELLELLDYLPLAITQATAFIEENNITIGEYTDLIQAGSAETMELLSTDQYDPGRDPENWRLCISDLLDKDIGIRIFLCRNTYSSRETR